MTLHNGIAFALVLFGQLALTASMTQGQEEAETGSSSPYPLDVGPVANWAPQDLPTAPVPAPSPVAEARPGAQARLTLAELEEIATANNPTLPQAARRIEALQGRQLQVGLYPNPVVGYIGDDMGEAGTAGQQGAFLGQKIVTAGKLRLNRTVVGQEIQQAQHAWEVQRWRVLNDVRAGAYEVLVAQRTIELNDQLVRIGEAGMKAAEALFRNQEVARIDVLQARVETNSAKLELDNARNQYVAAWRKLALVMGVPDMEPTPLADELQNEIPELSWDDSVLRLMSESPQLAHARAGVERARYTLARAYAERTPNFDIGGAVRYNNASRDTVAMIQIGLPLQIYNRNQGNIAKAQAEVAAARREVQRVELVLQDRLADAFKQYANARQQTRRYVDDILPDAKTTLELVRTGYEQGEFGYLELLTTQRTYFRVNLAYVGSLRELRVSSVRIDGMLMSGGLEAVGQ